MKLILKFDAQGKRVSIVADLPITETEFLRRIETGEADLLLVNGFAFHLTMQNGKPVARRRPDLDEPTDPDPAERTPEDITPAPPKRLKVEQQAARLKTGVRGLMQYYCDNCRIWYSRGLGNCPNCGS